MSDSLLSEMSRAAREHVLSDERWEGFARGALDPADQADLLSRARAAGLDEETIEAFGPRGKDFDDRLAEAALAAMKGPAKTRVEPAPARESAPANDNAPTGGRAPAKVLPWRPRPAFVAGAAALVAAAAAALLLSRRTPEMPAYAMLIEGGTQAQRSTPGDASGVVKVAAGNRLVITMRPETRAPGQVAARAYLFGPGPAPELKVPVDVADSGAARIAVHADELFRGAAKGVWDLCVAVGEPGRLPEARAAERPAARGRGFVTVCRQVEWAGPDQPR